MTKVKICGLTNLDDAVMAAQAGADYIGVIFSKSSKRAVTLSQAADICAAIRKTTAEIVGVFVDESVEEIMRICKQLDINTIQLHGDQSREQLPYLEGFNNIFYAIGNYSAVVARGRHCEERFLRRGNLLDIPDNSVLPLIDNDKPGSGKALDWSALTAPTRPFVLAGGLTEHNVALAIRTLRPAIVDVASGVEFSTSIRKDPDKVRAFINAVRPVSFGGQYLPEILMSPVQDLTLNWMKLKEDKLFLTTLSQLYATYSGRPSPLTEIKNFSAAIDGPRVFLKREDLLHTGSHKINNALGQCLLAKQLGKRRIIAETGAGQHGVATATACARLQLECVVYMGATDIARQKINVEKMELLGAIVIPVTQGAATLKDAVNEALRDWAESYETTHYCLGSALGPHPYPEMVRFFQSIISHELLTQLRDYGIEMPDKLIACVGGGSNAIGFFHHFIDTESVQLIGVEAGGKNNSKGAHAARFLDGSPGVLHGCFTMLLQDENGQVLPTHSISAGLDYPAVGPDHAVLHASGRAQYVSVTDDEALRAFYLLTKTEGIIPALESSHALAYLMQIAPELQKSEVVIVNLSGRGDKDINQLLAMQGAQ